MKRALELVRTRQGCAMMEIQPRFDVLLYGKNVGQLYFNLRGYVGSLPTPEGFSLQMPEGSIASFEREVSRLNREFAALTPSHNKPDGKDFHVSTNQPTEAPGQVERFDVYQVCPVVETTTPRGESTREAFHTLIDAIHAKEAFHRPVEQRIFWTLYGVRKGIAEAIADRGTEADTFDLLYSITGMQGRSGQTIYPVPFSPTA